MIQLGFFPLLYPVSSLLIPWVLIPTTPLINIPTLNSIWVYIPKNQSVTYIKNIPEFEKDFYLKISGYTHNILKIPQIENKNGGNKDFVCQYFKPFI